MGKIFFELFFGMLLGITLLTQIIAPCFSKKLKFFWIFRKNEFTNDASGLKSLDDLAKEANESVERMNSTKQKISTAEQTLNQIKSKTQ